MQSISDDKTVRSNTVRDLIYFNSRFLVTQAKKGEQKVSMMPAVENVFYLRRNDIVETSTENVKKKQVLATKKVRKS